jgi:hypothetical protein
MLSEPWHASGAELRIFLWSYVERSYSRNGWPTLNWLGQVFVRRLQLRWFDRLSDDRMPKRCMIAHREGRRPVGVVAAINFHTFPSAPKNHHISFKHGRRPQQMKIMNELLSPLGYGTK